jgi:hypothetical protein
VGGQNCQEAVLAIISNIFCDKHEVFCSDRDIKGDSVAFNRLVGPSRLRFPLLQGLAWDLAFVFGLKVTVEELELNDWICNGLNFANNFSPIFIFINILLKLLASEDIN